MYSKRVLSFLGIFHKSWGGILSEESRSQFGTNISATERSPEGWALQAPVIPDSRRPLAAGGPSLVGGQLGLGHDTCLILIHRSSIKIKIM